jgi:hypothetical protein
MIASSLTNSFSTAIFLTLAAKRTVVSDRQIVR